MRYTGRRAALFGLILGVLLPLRPLHAAEGDGGEVFVTVGTGVKVLPGLSWGFIPMPPTAALSVDIQRLRFRSDISYHPFVKAVHGTLGAGAVFVPFGKGAALNGGFQLRLPILLDLGCVAGTLEAGDGHDDRILWLLLGPSVGGDFTWWKANKLGFTISVKAGYQFRIDMDSYYPDDYSYAKETIGVMDVSVLFGVTI